MSPELLASVIAPLASNGVLGIGIIVIAWWCVKLQKRLEEVQEKRVSEAQAVTERLLIDAQRTHETGRMIASALDSHTQSIETLQHYLDHQNMPTRSYHQPPPGLRADPHAATHHAAPTAPPPPPPPPSRRAR